MILFTVYSFVFIALSLYPLWSDASRRPEYGKRPRILMVSWVLFLVIGAIDTALYLTGAFNNATSAGFAELVVIFCVFLYNLVILLAEYSVHHQRIQKNLLVDEFKDRLRLVWQVGAAELVSLVALFVIRFFQLSRNDFGIGILSAVATLCCFGAAIGFNVACLGLFDLQEGIIRRRTYPFRNGLFIVSLTAVIFFLRWATKMSGSVYFSLLSLSMLLFSLNYAFRVFQEYFGYRMHHLSTNYAHQQKQDGLRTELINKVLVSSPAEDVAIIHDILASYLVKIQESVPNPNVRTKSMMLFRRNGDLLSVDAKEFIIDHCVPLMNLPTLKRMRSENLEEYILMQVFDLEKVKKGEFDPTDFGAQAVRKMMEEKRPVYLTSLPEYLAQMFHLIVLYPVYNQDTLNAMVVIFKDTSDYVFPQETVLFEELFGLLSIATTQIAGKKVQEEKNRLHQEMDVAKNIQVSVLPREIRIEGYDIDSQMITASEVGGDLYDFVPTKFGNYLDVGDVAGHGLPAGIAALLHMAAFHGALGASETLGKQLEPNQLYDIVNRVLIGINRDRIGSDKFMTCNMLVERDGKFRYAGAHLVALVYRAAQGRTEELSKMIDHAAYLGISEFAESSMSAGDFSMAAGDVLILYTDGLTETRDRNEQFFGLENLKLALEANATRTASEIRGAVLDSLAVFAESGDLKRYGGSYADDVSIVVVKKS